MRKDTNKIINSIPTECSTTTMLINLGTFEVISGRLIVSDPCYERGNKYSGLLKYVRIGKWNAYVSRGNRGNWGLRNAELIISHVDFDLLNNNNDLEEKTDDDIDVYSGQVGFFDYSLYPANKDSQGEYNESGTFYGKCCVATLNTPNVADIIDNRGVVSSSGISDGGYGLHVIKNKDGEIIKTRIVFIYEDEDKEEYDELADNRIFPNDE